jgi:hypothetical protein
VYKSKAFIGWLQYQTHPYLPENLSLRLQREIEVLRLRDRQIRNEERDRHRTGDGF